MTLTKFVQDNILWLIPILTIAGAWVGSILARRTGKEANENSKDATDISRFTAITDALFTRAELQDADIKDLKSQVTELKKQYTAQAVELELVQNELETERASTKELKRVNASLVRYVGKLTRLWPQGTILPEPDEAIS